MAPAATAANVPPAPPPVRIVTPVSPALPAPPVPPVPSWTQRREDLERIAALLRAGLPMDRAFDDVAAVFGDGTGPAEDDVPVLLERFLGTGDVRGHLAALVDAVTERRSGEQDVRARLVARAEDALGTPACSDGMTRLGHLRRLALAAQDLLELLLPDEHDEPSGPFEPSQEEATPCPV
ncbi:DUF6415 family natural product biosynthesis protein [Streptomyces sp. PU10]|uniref:DUF6415 family natural product biosynthesis protein n=1 Tax=Streptomyces sp. PU10 TaxID=3062780 RepID=UPI0028FC54FD|nr:DUF6415 family natural product biosynthesis protein [Streptomyces sp. PU10]MDU0258473.1 DUF6415 family natural product biosynthesis protein [Streptomyces sp. PU10]